MNRFKYRELAICTYACPLCGLAGGEELARVDRYNMGIRTVACNSCGLLRTDPTMSDEAWASFYGSSYRKVYSKVEIPDANYLQRAEIARRAEYTAVRLVEAGLGYEGCSVLDVGCSEGSILRALSERVQGINAVGVEPGEHFSSFARTYAGCRVVANIETAASLGQRFDLIIVNHVLEHVTAPINFLRTLGSLCSDSGRIYVDVPDAERYSSMDDLHIAHVIHFTQGTLRAIAMRAGLRVERIADHSPPSHPPSIAMVAAIGTTVTDSYPPPGERERNAAKNVRAIAASAWRYKLATSLPRRVLARLAHRIRVFVGSPEP